MSQLTNYGENKLADFIRGQGSSWLPSSWYVAALTAYSDSSQTEAGVGLTRAAVARSLAAWAGTQGAGTTLASTGTSHATSNNASISLGTASGSATIVGFGLYDASSSGNCFAVYELDTPLAVASSDAVSIDAGALGFTLGLSGGMSDYLANKLIDLVFRGQAYSMPANMYAALFTSAPTNAGGGTEVGGGVGYSRATIASSMAAWGGTQGGGSTIASSGTGGRISNNAALAHPAPSGSWGTCPAMGLYDASSSGNLMFWRALTSTVTISSGSPAPTYAADDLGITFA